MSIGQESQTIRPQKRHFVERTNNSNLMQIVMGQAPVQPQIITGQAPVWINKITTFIYKTIAKPIAIDKPYINVHSVVIRQAGKEGVNVNWKGLDEQYSLKPGTVCEKTTYENGSLHRFNSAAKSVIGLLVLKLLSDNSKIKLETPILGVLGLNEEQKEEYKAWKNVTIKHCLNMTAGFEWDETGSYSTTNSNASSDKTQKNDASQSYLVDDLFEYILTKEISDTPGEKFNYSGGCSMLLGKIIETISGKSVEEYAQEVLFTPLGINRDHVRWRKTASGFTGCSGGLSMRPSDMAKIGQLLLNKGKWGDDIILKEECIEDLFLTEGSVLKGEKDKDLKWGFDAYKFGWWTQKIKLKDGKELIAHVAQGYGGQNLFVIPDQELVVVINTGNYSATDVATKQTPKRLLINEILPGLDIKTERFGETYE
tara:strand:+ start:272 stop:1549 length:1278 start_codon:yes stop_codon:yes gene_type:complete